VPAVAVEEISPQASLLEKAAPRVPAEERPWKSGASAPRKAGRNDLGFSPAVANRLRDLPYTFRRSADCASPFASALSSRGTCEMENASDRASFRQVQCKE